MKWKSLSIAALVFWIYGNLGWALAQTGHALSCASARARFKTLNRRLLFRDNDDAVPSARQFTNSTATLDSFLTQAVLKNLNADHDANELQAFLSCLQEDEEDQPWSDITNTPLVFQSKTSEHDLSVVSMMIMRGALAIPNTAPLLQCYVKHKSQWSFVGALGSDYEGSTFYVYPLPSPVQNESWFLLSGKTIGGTGSNVNLEVATCDGKQMKVKWKQDGFYGGSVEITGSTVAVIYNKRDKNGDFIRDSDGYGIEYTDVLHVTPKGLE